MLCRRFALPREMQAIHLNRTLCTRVEGRGGFTGKVDAAVFGVVQAVRQRCACSALQHGVLPRGSRGVICEKIQEIPLAHFSLDL